jgi:hypothetical protein
LQQVEEGKSKTFYCYRSHVEDIRQQLKDLKTPINTCLGNSPDMISALIAINRRKEQNGGKSAREPKVDIRIKVVPEDADKLQQLCQSFSYLNGDALIVYAGESMSAVFHKLFRVFYTSRRVKPQQETILIILARQAGRCALCRESLNGVYDIDHTLPLCLSGTTELENLRALCKECHKREIERLATLGCTVGTKNTVESHNPPHLFREVHMAPKPQEVVYGVPWKKKATKLAKAQNVSDLLSQHPVPEISEGSEILGKFKDV